MQFVDLKLSPPIQKALAEMGYQTPSPIQEKAIPPVLAGRDLFGCAQTGTGKTCAFAAPILQRLGTDRGGKHPPIRALVLTPTRELALQIYENFVQYGKYLPLRCAVIFGGVSQNPQVEKLQRGVDILVATSGRLNDLIGQGYISLKKVEIFVLDEGDRMLDMGFIHDVRRVVAQLPQERQTLLFSATLPPEIEKLARTILKNPLKVSVTPSATTAEKVSQSLYYVDKPNKKRLLADLLQQPEIESALVFTRTKHGADRVVKELGRAGIEAKAIHGNKSQGARQTALKAFKDRSIRVLVATDIAARGIDIDELSHVINYDLPNEPETYVHRIGRTGRAGLSGTAISFCMFDEIPYLKDIQKLIKQEIPVVKNHPYPMEILEPTPRQPRPPRRERPAPPRQSAARQPGGRPAAKGKPAGQGGQRGQNQPRKKK